MKVKELLCSEDKWTQCTYAIDAAGRCTSETSASAVKWCLVGAVMRCYNASPARRAFVLDKLREVIRKKYSITPPDAVPLACFNDNHTFAEVKAVIDAADV